MREIQEQVYDDRKTGVLCLSLEPVIPVEFVAGKEAEEDFINTKGTAYSGTEQSDSEIERRETMPVDLVILVSLLESSLCRKFDGQAAKGTEKDPVSCC
jgi:hypothetical protein